MNGDLYRLIPEEGKHLAESHNTEGAYRGVYLDDETNKPSGAGEFVKVEEDEYESDNSDVGSLDSDVAAIAGLITIGMGIGVVTAKTYPYVKEWVSSTAVPGVKKIWNKIRKTEKLKKEEITQEIKEKNAIVDVTYLSSAKDFAHNVDKVMDEYKENVGSEEAQAHLLNIMCCAMYMASEIRKLSNVVIKDDAFDEKQRLEWKFAMEKLTTQNVTDSINQILEKNLSTLDNAEVERLALFMGDSLILNGRFVPIKNEKVKEALQIEV